MRDQATDLLKFAPPGPPSEFIARPRLSRALAEGLRQRLTLLVAPAGYGKTSLLSSMAHRWEWFSQQAGAEHLAWFQLDSTDNDPAVFLEGLVRAFRGPIPGFGLPTLLALRGTADPSRRLDRLITVFLDDLIRSGREGMVLALDDFHRLTNRDMLNAVDRHFVASEAPFRLVISSRTDPPMYLGGHRTRGEVLELGIDDLRFSVEEVRELLQRRVGSSVPEETVTAVFRETKGWPSFVFVAALLAERSGGVIPLTNLAPTEHGHARMVSEVVRQLPWEKRDVLLRSSLLPFLDDAACANTRVMGKANGILTFIREAGLPAVAPAAASSLLRYDPLFRSALERELQQTLSPEEYRALQLEAAIHCEEQGDWHEAISRYLLAGDGEAAASLVERAAGLEMEMGHTETVFQWIRSLPTAVRRSHPRLIVEEGKLLMLRGQLDEARATLASAKLELLARGDSEGEAERLGAWALLALKEGNPEEARRSVAEALARLADQGGGTAGSLFLLLSSILEKVGDLRPAHTAASEAMLIGERTGRWSQVVDAMLQLARIAHTQGRPNEALALSARGIQRARTLGTDLLSVSIMGGMASTAYLDRGDIHEAAVVAGKSLETSRQTQDQAGQIRALLAVAAVQDRTGEPYAARASLEEAAHIAAKLHTRAPERALATRAEAVYLLTWGSRGKGVKKAREAARLAAEAGSTVLVEESRLVVAAGELAGPAGRVQALPVLLRLSDAFRRQGNARWHSAVLSLLADAYVQLGIGRSARESFDKALSYAAREGYSGLPLGLSVHKDRLLRLSVWENLAPRVAARFLGVSLEEAQRALAPLFREKNVEAKARAEALLTSLQSDSKRSPARILWPGLPEQAGDDVPGVYLHTLGRFSPWIDQQEAAWPSLDAGTLAAYLLIQRGQEVSREELLTALWPEMEPAAGNIRLQVALYQLGESMGPGYSPAHIELEPGGSYRWDGAGCAADIDAFFAAVQRVRDRWDSEQSPALSAETVRDLQGAVDLYDGEFMSDLDYEWCVPLRDDLRAHLIWSTRVLVSHYMARREWGEALRNGLKSSRSDPLQEDITRDVMLASHKLGDRDGVLRHYRELKRILAKERGAWPSEETRQLRVRLLGR
jgi:LuxR family transcriptional regulator, maltose regulon positive regulatory protein